MWAGPVASRRGPPMTLDTHRPGGALAPVPPPERALKRETRESLRALFDVSFVIVESVPMN
jgi:hypothetical protein